MNSVDQQLARLEEQQADSRFLTPVPDMFPAKLTAYDSGTGYYSWTEQNRNTSGARVDRLGGRTGSPTWMPAILMNGAVISTFPFDVWLIRTIQTDTLGVVYEAIAALPFEEMNLIDKICVTKNSGVVTDINIQRRTYLVAAQLQSLAGTCVTTDENCCPILTECCPDNAIPRTIHVTLENISGYFFGSIPDGTYAMTYLEDGIELSGTTYSGWQSQTFPKPGEGCYRLVLLCGVFSTWKFYVVKMDTAYCSSPPVVADLGFATLFTNDSIDCEATAMSFVYGTDPVISAIVTE